MTEDRIRSEEWNFSWLDEMDSDADGYRDHLLACRFYELARESRVVRRLRDELRGGPPHGRGPRRSEVKKALETLKNVGSAPYDMLVQVLMCPGFYETPWICLSEKEAQRLVMGGPPIEPIVAANIAELRNLYEEFFGDARPSECSWTDRTRFSSPDYLNDMLTKGSSASTISDYGYESVILMIDWENSSNNDLSNAFGRWLLRRREEHGIPEPETPMIRRKARKGQSQKDIRDTLWNIGIMRLVKSYSNESEKFFRAIPKARAIWESAKPGSEPSDGLDSLNKDFIDAVRKQVRNAFSRLLGTIDADRPLCYFSEPS